MKLINYIEPKHQIFLCFDENGNCIRVKCKNKTDKQVMQQRYLLYIQVGRTKDVVNVELEDNTTLKVQQSGLRINKTMCSSKRQIITAYT